VVLGPGIINAILIMERTGFKSKAEII